MNKGFEELLKQPVLCEDGRSHYIDESHRRYLASELLRLLTKSDEELPILTPVEVIELTAVSGYFVSKSQSTGYLECVKSLLEYQRQKWQPLLSARIHEAERKERERIEQFLRGKNGYKLQQKRGDGRFFENVVHPNEWENFWQALTSGEGDNAKV